MRGNTVERWIDTTLIANRTPGRLQKGGKPTSEPAVQCKYVTPPLLYMHIDMNQSYMSLEFVLNCQMYPLCLLTCSRVRTSARG